MVPAANGPPPTVWWSAAAARPQPIGFGVQLAPSLSVKAMSEHAPANCDTNVRPVEWSVNRIGSSVVVDVSGCPTFAQVGGDFEKSTRSVSSPPWYMTWPLFQFAPIDGSPASRPSPAGAE